MGITSNDIAAQRAMLARGEEKRKAAKQAAERERLRDTFAAVALPLCTRNGRNAEQISESAYKLADAMLRERGNHSAKPNSSTNHDAVPEARVQQSTREPERSLLAQSESVERGLPRTGNTLTPTDDEREAVEAAIIGSCEMAGTLRNLLERNDHDAVPEARARDADRGRTDKAVTRPGDGTGDTPSPESYEQGDEKRVNTNTNWDATQGECSVRGEGTQTVGQRLVERLSVTQSLLDDNEKLRAEIDALEFVVYAGGIANGWDKDILRQWLIRLRPEFDSAEAIKEGDSDRSQPIGSPAKTNPTQPRNGTPVEGSVPGEGSVPDSRSENEPVAWAVMQNDWYHDAHLDYYKAVKLATAANVAGAKNPWNVVPLYRHPPCQDLSQKNLTLTDEEREAVEAADAYMSAAGCHNTNVQKTLRGLLERLGESNVLRDR